MVMNDFIDWFRDIVNNSLATLHKTDSDGIAGENNRETPASTERMIYDDDPLLHSFGQRLIVVGV